MHIYIHEIYFISRLLPIRTYCIKVRTAKFSLYATWFMRVNLGAQLITNTLITRYCRSALITGPCGKSALAIISARDRVTLLILEFAEKHVMAIDCRLGINSKDTYKKISQLENQIYFDSFIQLREKWFRQIKTNNKSSI